MTQCEINQSWSQSPWYASSVLFSLAYRFMTFLKTAKCTVAHLSLQEVYFSLQIPIEVMYTFDIA